MNGWRKHVTLLILYSLLAIILTWPLVLNFASAVPGIEGDAASYVWALGWAKTALADLHVNPFHTDYVYFPLGGATQLLWAVSLVGFVSVPLQFLFGLVASHNLLYIAATVLTAYGTFLLADEVLQVSGPKLQAPDADSPSSPFVTLLVTQFVVQSRLFRRRSVLAPFVAGLAFAFAPLRLGYGLAFLNLYNTEFIPFYLLFLLRATRERSRRDAILGGLFLGLNAYLDFQIAAFLVLLTGIYAIYAVVTENHGGTEIQRNFRAFVPLWFLTALVSLVVAAPMLAAVANDFAVEGGNYIQIFKLDYSAARSYDLLSFFVPNARSTLYAGAPLKIVGVNATADPGDLSAVSPDRQMFVGYVVLALAVYAVARRWRQARLWFFVAVLFALFSLGPTLRVLGQNTGIPLPYLALHEIPIVNHIRIPMRYGIVVSFALAILAGIGIWKLQATRWRLLAYLAPIAILAEFAVLPFPLQPFSVPSVYEQIARVPGDFTVLEIPSIYWRGAAATEPYQAFHGKRILRAYTNRIAPELAEYFGYRGTPIVVRSLRALEGIDQGGLAPEDIAEDRRVRDQVLSFYDLRFAVVHRDLLKLDQVQNIDSYLRDVLGARVIADDGTVVGYELPRVDAPNAAAIDLRENIGQMYAGRGWQFQYPPANSDGQFNFVWARGTRSEIYFRLASAGERMMTLHAYAATPQRVTVWLNGTRVGEIELTPDWRDYRVTLPAQVGMNRVELAYSADWEETIGVTTIDIEESGR